MKEHERMAGRFWQVSLEYLEAAQLANNQQRGRGLYFVCLHNIGHSLELYLKSHLVVLDGPGTDPKKYSHHIRDMWNDDRLEHIRQKAISLLEDSRRPKGIVIHMMTAMEFSREKTMDSYIELLSEQFSNASNYALRYPPDSIVKVPDPKELLYVLPKLYHREPPLDVLRR